MGCLYILTFSSETKGSRVETDDRRDWRKTQPGVNDEMTGPEPRAGEELTRGYIKERVNQTRTKPNGNLFDI